MAELTIKTNHHWREMTRGYEIDAANAMRSDFDYLSVDEFDEAEFFRYRGVWYCTDQFMRFGYPFGGHPEDSPFKDWDGYCGDSYFSGVVLKWDNDFEFFKVGTYHS